MHTIRTTKRFAVSKRTQASCKCYIWCVCVSRCAISAHCAYVPYGYVILLAQGITYTLAPNILYFISLAHTSDLTQRVPICFHVVPQQRPGRIGITRLANETQSNPTTDSCAQIASGPELSSPPSTRPAKSVPRRRCKRRRPIAPRA